MNVSDIKTIYESVAPKVTNFLVAGGTPYSAACDIVQETFLRIWKMKDELDGDESRISGLAHTIARNLRNDRFRRDRFMTYKEEIEDHELVADGQAPTPGDNDYLKKRLDEALSKLPPLLREAFLLFQVSEMTIRDISLQLGIGESLVKIRIFRAKNKLKELLSDLGGW